MQTNCQFHPDCNLKYFCVDPACTVKTKISCAECQIEGPHKKHDFKNIQLFKNLIGDIASTCCDYLKKFSESDRIIQQIKEEFEYMRLYASEVLQQIEKIYISQIQGPVQSQKKNSNDEQDEILSTSTNYENQIEKLISLQRDTIKQGNDFIENFDQFYLFNLYQQKEQMFNQNVEASNVPFKSISNMKVSIVNYFQGQLAQSKKQQNKQQIQKENEAQPMLEVSTFQRQLVSEVELPNSENYKQSEMNYCARIMQNYDKDTFLIVTNDHIIRICEKNTLKILKEFKGHNWLINSVIQLNENYLLSCSSDTSIKLWNITETTMQQNIKQHSHEVTTILHFKDNYILSGGKDYTIYFYEIENNESNQKIVSNQTSEIDINNQIQNDNSTSQNNLIIHEGENLIQQSNDKIQINESQQSININQKSNNNKSLSIKQIHEMKYLDYPIKQIEKINEVFFVVGYSNGQIGLADFNQRQFLYILNDKHELGLYCIANIDESHFCSSGGDGKVKIWNTSQRNSIGEYQFRQQGYINRLKVLKQNKCISFSAMNNIEVISYSSFIQTDQNNNTKNQSKNPLADRKILLKILSLSTPKNQEINDFVVSKFESELQGIHTRIVVAPNNSKLQYYA